MRSAIIFAAMIIRGNDRSEASDTEVKIVMTTLCLALAWDIVEFFEHV